jgi:hypothetical protein
MAFPTTYATRLELELDDHPLVGRTVPVQPVRGLRYPLTIAGTLDGVFYGYTQAGALVGVAPGAING